jgi:hypothetical protein
MVLGIDVDAERPAERVHEPATNESPVAIVQLDPPPWGGQ